MTRIGFESLGCPKNLVDSETLLGLARGSGLEPTAELDRAEVIVLNTCAFLAEARREALDRISELARFKQGKCRLLIVAGCLVPWLIQRSRPAPAGVDLLLDFSQYPRLPELIASRLDLILAAPSSSTRLVSTSPHYAYLRIAEGCNNRCRYCLIPSLRGELRSLPVAEIREESRRLAAAGYWEQILVAQDVAAYRDPEGKGGLADLLGFLEEVEELRWLRVLYAHPAHVDDALLDRLASATRILPYLDVPLQHAADSVLRRMGRPGSRDDLRRLVERAREKVPGICLRTTMMVGFPGETPEEFDQLLDFLSWARFDHLGAFAYSPEEGTPAAGDPSPVPAAEAVKRREEVMLMQQEISAAALARRRGDSIEVVAEKKFPDSERDLLLGRAWFQAPEIDGVAVISGKGIDDVAGPWQGMVTDSSEYDVFVQVEP